MLKRSFINVLQDLAHKYSGLGVTVADLRRLEKLKFKHQKHTQDITFLNNCKNFGVYPKFITFSLPQVSPRDATAIRRRLLKSAIYKQNKEKIQCKKDTDKLSRKLKESLSFFDWFILNKVIDKEVDKKIWNCINRHQKKLSQLTKHRNLQCLDKSKIITNLTNYELTQEETELLKHGLSYSIAPPFLSKTEVFCSFENINYYLSKNLKNANDKTHLKAELSYLAHSYYFNYKPSPRVLRQHRVLKSLRQNNDIIICKPDKGNGIVILDRKMYEDGILELISDKKKFKEVKEDPTKSKERSLQNYLRVLRKDGFFDQQDYVKLYPNGTSPARIYGTPKMHKFKETDDFPKLRPIVSSIGTFNYNLAKYLCTLLSPLVPNKHSCKDTFTFVNELKQTNLSGKYFVSYDVTSLFTNIPLKETINLAVDLILNSDKNIKINKKKLTKLFIYCTSQTHFLFKGKFYIQIDGVAMGSPLAPVLANLFMGFNEINWIKNYDAAKPTFYRRYVDDILAVFNTRNEATDFFNYLNQQHPNIKFTIEYNIDNKIAFLDALICNTDNNIITKTYHKPTYTGLLLNFNSFTSFSYKSSLVKCLIDRAFKINNTWKGFNEDIMKLTNTLTLNGYPKSFINKNINSYLNNFFNLITKDSENTNCSYFKLPYIGKFSNHTKKKIKTLIKRFCKDNVNIKLVFNSYKIKQYFSAKDKIPSDLKSNIVYKFTCARCNASYIGETCRHISTRMDEHFRTDKKSHVYKHLHKNHQCLNSCDLDCFEILDSASTHFNLKIKEALYIKWNNPSLNSQVKHYNLNLF